jgi:phage gp46-like protein
MTNILTDQQGDVFLFQTVDDGEIEVQAGLVVMHGGLETAAYLSLFGGNEDDSGRKSDKKNWWGNLNETDLSKKFRSETQYLLKSISGTSSNLKRVEDAASRDLNWMIQDKVATEITVNASIPALNKIKISIAINANEDIHNFEFLENWRASA